MNSIVNFAAQQPCQRAQTSAHVLPTTWLGEAAPQGVLRLRDAHVAVVAGLAVDAATKHVAVKAKAAKAAAAAVRLKGSVAWSPPPC